MKLKEREKIRQWNTKRPVKGSRVGGRGHSPTKSGQGAKDKARYAELQSACHVGQQIEAQALLGVAHELREPYPAELGPYRPENFEMWHEAAELGIPDGQYLLGKCLLNSGQVDEGRNWLAQAAAGGHLPAKRDLGVDLLNHGQSSKGLKLLLQAIKGGDAHACELLAYHYEGGDGVGRSPSKYRAFLKQAATLGSVRAKLLVKTDRVK